MDANTSTATAGSSSTPVTVPLAPSKQGRTPGKAHKSAKSAKARSYISSAIKTPFEKRKEAENKRAAVKGVERDMKEEIEAEKERKRNNIKERRERIEEKKRLEEMASKMSARKLQRLRKRQGRSKKING